MSSATNASTFLHRAGNGADASVRASCANHYHTESSTTDQLRDCVTEPEPRAYARRPSVQAHLVAMDSTTLKVRGASAERGRMAVTAHPACEPLGTRSRHWRDYGRTVVVDGVTTIDRAQRQDGCHGQFVSRNPRAKAGVRKGR